MYNMPFFKKDRKNNKFMWSNFSLEVVLYLDNEVFLVYRLFALFLSRLGAHAPVPYVQDTILNLNYPYLGSTTGTS